MSTLDLDTGRRRQKLRTRDALVTAAREAVRDGDGVTVERVAERAGISRTTAYRYFPNRRLLLAAAHPETVTESLLGPDASDDVADRLDQVVDAFTTLVGDTEQQQRTMLRLSLEPGAGDQERLPLRQGRAIRWIEEALEPLHGQLDEEQIRGLTLAIRATTGIEALVWLKDVAGLSRVEAQALMCWSARALLDAARTTPPPGAAGSSRTARIEPHQSVRWS